MKNAVFWILRLVALVRIDVSEEHIASIIRVARICDLGATLAVTSNRCMLPLLVTANVPGSPSLVILMMAAPHSSET
jgi:hypothetical protein